MNNEQIKNEFHENIKIAILESDKKHEQSSLGIYRPSKMHCEREMVFSRMNKPNHSSRDYQLVGMAQTGTHRHSDIQNALLTMDGFEYLDVEEWINSDIPNLPHKLSVVRKDEHETRLYCEDLNVEFQCDGVLKHIKTNRFFLFEFKNKMSFATRMRIDTEVGKGYKYVDSNVIPDKHIVQISLYGYLLGLDNIIYLCERRDDCYLLEPVIQEITDEQKQVPVDMITNCEEHYNAGTFPDAQTKDLTYCRNYCGYKEICREIGY